jgi:hypothetical protein
MKPPLRIVLLIAGMNLAATSLTAAAASEAVAGVNETELVGRVTNAATGSPLEGARVTIQGMTAKR